MNLNVNNVNFSGKKEILYGLNKASESALHFNHIHAANKGFKGNEELVAVTTAYTYLDMIIRDGEFVKVVNKLTEKQLKPIKENLKESATEHGTIKPFKTFKMIIDAVMKKYRGKNKAEKAAITEELLNRLL